MDRDAVLKKSSAPWPSATVGKSARSAAIKPGPTMRKPRRCADILDLPIGADPFSTEGAGYAG
jgi:hypothetical protein